MKRLLEVDRRVFLPLNMHIRIIVTSGDVLHSWAVPELGVKVDAVPGRLNQFLVFIQTPGVFYGQCSELCGVSHGFMPIVIQALPFDDFSYWLNSNTYEVKEENEAAKRFILDLFAKQKKEVTWLVSVKDVAEKLFSIRADETWQFPERSFSREAYLKVISDYANNNTTR
jgi:heme/copper-type cytochrome/quinol oxidase subunit 2